MTARWRVETTEQFDRQFRKLDRAVQRRVLSYLEDLEDLETLDDPRQRGKGLTANHSGVWRYRVGDFRVLAQILDDTLVVLAVTVDHRKDVCRTRPADRGRAGVLGPAPTKRLPYALGRRRPRPAADPGERILAIAGHGGEHPGGRDRRPVEKLPRAKRHPSLT